MLLIHHVLKFFSAIAGDEKDYLDGQKTLDTVALAHHFQVRAD
jgi:hypothetical protein